jgi:hypothetical protein
VFDTRNRPGNPNVREPGSFSMTPIELNRRPEVSPAFDFPPRHPGAATGPLLIGLPTGQPTPFPYVDNCERNADAIDVHSGQSLRSPDIRAEGDRRAPAWAIGRRRLESSITSIRGTGRTGRHRTPDGHSRGSRGASGDRRTVTLPAVRDQLRADLDSSRDRDSPGTSDGLAFPFTSSHSPIFAPALATIASASQGDCR